jgi:hypothetical protein
MSRGNGLERLAALYTMVERMHSLAVRVAAEAVEDVACRVEIETAVHRGNLAAGRNALAEGRPEERLIEETAGGLAEVRLERLAELRGRREAVLEEAVTMHRRAYLETEQMARLVKRRRERQALEEGRKEQAEADDRFASRGAWEDASLSMKSR